MSTCHKTKTTEKDYAELVARADPDFFNPREKEYQFSRRSFSAVPTRRGAYAVTQTYIDSNGATS